MVSAEDADTIREIAERRGRKFVERALLSGDGGTDVLTIISNSGVHPIPLDYVFGDVFVASNGSLDFTSEQTVNAEIDEIVKSVSQKLRERRWTKVYLIPFGHAVISMNIKMVVFRVLRIETIDVFYFGDGRYGLIERNTRSTLTED